MKHAVISAVGGYLPETLLTNSDLEKMVDTNDEWITTRTGIKQRHILKGEHAGPSYMGIRAVNDLFTKNNTKPGDIEVVICSTNTPDYVFPNTASIIAKECGMTNAYCYDISAACSGFLYAFSQAASLIESGRHSRVMVVSAEKMSAIVNYKDRATCPLFGDGAGAVLVTASDDEKTGYMDSILCTDGSGMQFLNLPAGGAVNPATYETIDSGMHYVHQDGRPVYKAAVTGMSEATLNLMKRNNLTSDDVNWVIPHQANIRIIESVTHAIELAPERMLVNISEVGNTSSASIPLVMWQNESRFKKGDKIILTAFGAGFTWGSLYLVWGY